MFISRTLLILGTLGVVLLGLAGGGFGVWYWALRESRKGAVVTNGHECADIGGDVLKEGGTAVDAAVAALFCEGVAQPQSMGLGGGFLMTIYIRHGEKRESLDTREEASEQASENMYDGDASLSEKGGLSVAIPGELKGYWEAHQKYGKLPWARLVEPTIQLCKNGHLVTKFLEGLFKRQEAAIRRSPTLSEIYIDPLRNETWKEGQRVKRPKLARTLELVAQGTPDVLYQGILTDEFIKDIKNEGGIITKNDLKQYKPRWSRPIEAKMDQGRTLYTSPLPGSGIILSFIFNVLNGFLDTTNIDTVTNWQRIIETFKYGYAKRTELGDPDYVSGIGDLISNLTSEEYAAGIRSQIEDTRTFQNPEHYGANFSTPEDRGTAHISVLAPNGDAVSVTSTINQYFGAGFVSRSTGIILNDEMNDFSAPNITNGFGLPPSPANFIVPHKRPLSSMCPSIVTDDNGDVILVIGAAGGTRITTSVTLTSLRILLFNEPVKESVDAPRLHHQLIPMYINSDEGFNEVILDGLRKIGHVIAEPSANTGFAALTAISRLGGKTKAAWDPRRTGSISYV